MGSLNLKGKRFVQDEIWLRAQEKLAFVFGLEVSPNF